MTALEQSAPQAYRESLLPKLRANGWVVAGILIVSASALAPVIQNSLITTQGLQIETLEAQQFALRVEMRQLESEISRLISIDRIQRRAGEIGLAPGADAIFVTIGEAGPEHPKIPAEHLLEPSEPDSGFAP